MFACSSYSRVLAKEGRKNQVGTWPTSLHDPLDAEDCGSIAWLKKEERDCKTTSFD